jgi:hypothetical protein
LRFLLQVEVAVTAGEEEGRISPATFTRRHCSCFSRRASQHCYGFLRGYFVIFKLINVIFV